MQAMPVDPFSFAQEQLITSNPSPKPNPTTSVMKERNLPGTPDPDAEVIALSPKSLMATNRFICEICNKGFQRDQNLQLHLRGHNLPWKLKQRRSGGESTPRKKVYICPEKSCAHHDPSRALGDLTGIKKHYSRKHGEKKWKCDNCSKKYAVQSDWKAHVKTCGTREYKCDCGTLFSRKDTFITHRAFCDALVEESARITSANDSAPNPSRGLSNWLGVLNVENGVKEVNEDETYLSETDKKGDFKSNIQSETEGCENGTSLTCVKGKRKVTFADDTHFSSSVQEKCIPVKALFASSSMSNFNDQNQLRGLSNIDKSFASSLTTQRTPMAATALFLKFEELSFNSKENK